MLQNQTTHYRGVINKKHTNDHVWSFLGFLHNDMIDLPMKKLCLAATGIELAPRVGTGVDIAI
jgi:hypothetical protein